MAWAARARRPPPGQIPDRDRSAESVEIIYSWRWPGSRAPRCVNLLLPDYYC